MNWLDAVLGLILGASVFTSFRKGFSREIVGLIAVVLALVLGLWFYGTAGGYLLPYLSSRHAANFAGFLLVFGGVMLLGALVNFIVGKFLRVTGLSFFDHLMGAGFGLLRAGLIGIALITAIMAFSKGDEPPGPVVHSRIAPYVIGGANVAAAIAPHELKEGFERAYSQVKTAWATAVDQKLRAPGADKGQK
jgi:membrane protein required for colicin V production